jgi:hypothetical protein
MGWLRRFIRYPLEERATARPGLDRFLKRLVVAIVQGNIRIKIDRWPAVPQVAVDLALFKICKRLFLLTRGSTTSVNTQQGLRS